MICFNREGLRKGLEEQHRHVHRNEPRLDLAPTPRPTLASNKEVL